MRILGVEISEFSLQEALSKTSGFLGFSTGRKIFTPNPEMLVKAQTDEYFKNVLNSGDLNLCDGFGLWLATRGKCPRITGGDFMIELCAPTASSWTTRPISCF